MKTHAAANSHTQGLANAAYSKAAAAAADTGNLLQRRMMLTLQK